jgi:hypothetical protein
VPARSERELGSAEQDLIQFWGGYYNQENQQFRAAYESMPTTDLLFYAGEEAGGYRYDGMRIHAGKLKLMRTVLWRRDEAVVPPGSRWSETPRDFHQDWDFADFPALSPNGFIRTMGCLRPAGSG